MLVADRAICSEILPFYGKRNPVDNLEWIACDLFGPALQFSPYDLACQPDGFFRARFYCLPTGATGPTS